MAKRTIAKPPQRPQPRGIPADMPRTAPSPRHPVDGWEAANTTNAEIGALRISHVPGSTLIGLFIRVGAIMFPLAYFRNWHAAHRFVAWMEGSKEPEPTLQQQWSEMMASKMGQVGKAVGIVATMSEGVATFDITNEAVVPTTALPEWPADKDDESEEQE